MTGPTPVLHLLAGPNGAGKSSYHRRVIAPLGLPFVNADVLASERWPEDPLGHGHDASRLAGEMRERALAAGTSFATETVFSHTSKLDLVRQAADAGYLVYLYAMVVPVELSVLRVRLRVAEGGHDVPEAKIRGRYLRLWELVAAAIDHSYQTVIIDSRYPTFPELARFRFGQLTWCSDFDLGWVPDALVGRLTVA